MAWAQVIQPNLDDDPAHPLVLYQNGQILKNWAGWCLAAVKASYGATKSMGCAWNAWCADGTKHEDYDLPEGVYCPVYWEGGGGDYGHICIALRQGNNVKIWSTPTKSGWTYVTYSGEIHACIDGVTSRFGLKRYAGWTEFVCEKRVIQTIQNKSNEEICAEIWAGEWGNGKEREQRLTAAGYDYATIQKMIDAGVGKPEPEPEPTPEPQPEPETPQEGSDEPDEPASPEPVIPGNDNPTEGQDSQPESPSDENKQDDEQADTNGEVVPANPADTKFIGGIISEASGVFNPSDTVKVIAYLVGDALLMGAVLVPDIVNTIQAPTASTWAEYLSRTLMEAGVFILLIFKLIKKGK